jgi:hypothetical protein
MRDELPNIDPSGLSPAEGLHAPEKTIIGEAQDVPSIPVADPGPAFIVAGTLIELEVAVVLGLLCEIATVANEPAIKENAMMRTEAPTK